MGKTPGIYEDLIDRIWIAHEEMLKCSIEANKVIINGNTYVRLNEYFMRAKIKPSIIGLRVEIRNDLPDDWDFIVQHEEKGRRDDNV